MAMSVPQNRRKLSRSVKKPKIEFSKLIVIASSILFICVLWDIRAATIKGLDVSGYAMQEIVTCGGILCASIVFYLNKAKIENLSKGKLRFALLKLRMEIRLKKLVPEECYDAVSEELDELNSMIDGKLDGSLENAIQREVDENI